MTKFVSSKGKPLRSFDVIVTYRGVLAPSEAQLRRWLKAAPLILDEDGEDESAPHNPYRLTIVEAGQ